MRKFLHQYPLHPFLLTFFLSFFLYAQNVELIQLHMMHRTFVAGTFVAILIYGIVYFFIKEKTKAGIITTLIFLALFNYGVLYDFLENLYYSGYWPLKNIHRYAIILYVIYIVTVVCFVNKKIVVGTRVNYFLNILILFLLCFNVIKLVLNSINIKHQNSIVVEGLKYNPNKKLPNIYYMVLDGYANEHILKKHYNYDNSAFISFLTTNNFYVADSSFSNYYSTSPSLSATFNMEYHLKDSVVNYFEKIRTNKVLAVLKQEGYKTYRLQSGYAVTSGFSQIDSIIKIKAPNEFERSILKYSICRLDDLFGFIPFLRLKSQIEMLDVVANLNSVAPKFIFIHIVAPHPPYVFNENGKRTFSIKDGDNSWEPKKNYIAQLKYINKISQNFISAIINKDSNAVFILQSDHGPWLTSKNADDVFDTRSKILNCIRFGNSKKHTYLTKNISSVNTFRAVFKTYLDSTYTLIANEEAGKENLVKEQLFKSMVLSK